MLHLAGIISDASKCSTAVISPHLFLALTKLMAITAPTEQDHLDLCRKNAAYQRRNRRSNCCLTVTPIMCEVC